jgi:hypothetical protein
MKKIEAIVRVQDIFLLRIHPSIVKTARISNGSLFEQVLTEEGILLKRSDIEGKEDVGLTPGRTSPTPARSGGGAS